LFVKKNSPCIIRRINNNCEKAYIRILFSKQNDLKEGIIIRYSRKRKFKSKYKILISSIQILTIWYVVMISAMQFNTFTNAAFNDIEEINASLHVKWPIDEWDNSSLDFDPDGVELDRGGTCIPPYVYAEIYNDGEDMTFSTWTWELYKVQNGQKIPISPVLESGEVPMIQANTISLIKTSNLQSLTEGTYRFKVNKPDRPGQDAIWSEPITVSGCTQLAAPKTAEPKQETQPVKETESNNGTQSSNNTTTEPVAQPAESTEKPAAELDQSTGTTTTSEPNGNAEAPPAKDSNE
jgi:YqxM protein